MTTVAETARWMKRDRWAVSHLIMMDSSARFVDASTDEYRTSACGKRVTFDADLVDEPSIIGGFPRCERCRRKAAALGADDTP